MLLPGYMGSVNQRLPSGPVVIPQGELVGRGDWERGDGHLAGEQAAIFQALEAWYPADAGALRPLAPCAVSTQSGPRRRLPSG